MITVVFMPIISLGNFVAKTKKKNGRTEEKILHQNRESAQLQHTLKNENKKNSNEKMTSIKTDLKKTKLYKNLRKNTLKGKKEQKRIKTLPIFFRKKLHHWIGR